MMCWLMVLCAMPQVCDFKLGDQYCGSFPGEPGFNEITKLKQAGEPLYSMSEEDQMTEKARAFKQYKRYKDGKNSDGLNMKDVTNVEVGLKTPMDHKELKALMKAWKQEKNNLESPVRELKFRCCGMKVVSRSEQQLRFKFEPQKSDGVINMTKPQGMTPEVAAEVVQDFVQHDSELAEYFMMEIAKLRLWFAQNSRYRFYASSVCLFYDLEDTKKRDVRWLDFAHAHEIVDETGEHQQKHKAEGGATNDSVEIALDNLCDLLAPVVYEFDGMDHSEAK